MKKKEKNKVFQTDTLCDIYAASWLNWSVLWFAYYTDSKASKE